MAVFYEKHGGCVLSTSINKYIYIFINHGFHKERTIIKYSKVEDVKDINEIEHPIFKYLLNSMGISGVELASVSDIPAGTGLGSSSSFTVGLLNALLLHKGETADKGRLAEEACTIEIEKLGSPIGKQDQYAAAFGGFNFIKFSEEGSVTVEPLSIKKETYAELQSNLLMLYVGNTRSANGILAEQKQNVNDDRNAKSLLEMCRLAKEMKSVLEKDDLSSFGRILHESWMLKQGLASGITSSSINELYNAAIDAGASGGKLLGAGGGGFFLFYCENGKQKKISEKLGLTPLDFEFESGGTCAVYRD